ncbi:MAG: DNA-binding response regulator [Sulfurimonas sp.]|nr:MAG: DNA-binding response regulator [Sulfurimonas sp.]
MKKKILLLEDDRDLGLTIKELLEFDGYDVSLVIDGEQAAEISYEKKFDLYVFDINVPEINGFDLLDGLRKVDDNTPAIFISALVDLESISRGFKVGADDYIKKPFFPEELLIRVNAKFVNKHQELVYKNLSYDIQKKIIRKDGEILALGDVQERLFDIFISNIGQILDKSVLMDCLENPSPTALRVALSKLKKTTGFDIKNIRGTGYILE